MSDFPEDVALCFKQHRELREKVTALEAQLQTANKALEGIAEIAKQLYEKDNEEFMKAPKGNPGNCWEAPSRHLQSFSHIRDLAWNAWRAALKEEEPRDG